MIADSCFIIDLMRGKSEAVLKLEEITHSDITQYVTTPTVMELAVGISMAGLPDQERQRVDMIMDGFQVLPLDVIAAWRAGLELGRLRNKGVIVDPVDAQIAGIALRYNETVVTRDRRHFDHFADLRVESY